MHTYIHMLHIQREIFGSPLCSYWENIPNFKKFVYEYTCTYSYVCMYEYVGTYVSASVQIRALHEAHFNAYAGKKGSNRIFITSTKYYPSVHTGTELKSCWSNKKVFLSPESVLNRTHHIYRRLKPKNDFVKILMFLAQNTPTILVVWKRKVFSVECLRTIFFLTSPMNLTLGSSVDIWKFLNFNWTYSH